jgi:uncharacterized protein (DUF697 family)
MTRKPLPKAIRRPAGDAPEGVADDGKDDKRRRRQDQEPVTALVDAQVPAPEPLAPHDPQPGTDVTPAESEAERRLTEGCKIVERHKYYAAVGGLLPLPIVSVAGVTAINLKMVKALSDLYGVPFERDRTRSIIVGLMGGAVPTGFAAATASTLVFVIPGSAFIGLAVSSVTAAACTRGIGMVFIDHFENTSGDARMDGR